MKNPLKNASLPAPKWFRILKKLVSWLTTLTLAICMIYLPEDSKTLLVIKLIQSSIMELFDTILANGEIYYTPQKKNHES
jgi:hypothetical protein